MRREMKGSGVEWIGEIPEKWEQSKTTRVFDLIGSGTTPNTTINEYYNGSINWIQSGDINGEIIYETQKSITVQAMENVSALRIYTAPFIVIAMYGASIANVSISKINACVNQACCVLSKTAEDIYYYFYCFIAAKDFIINYGRGGTQPNISQELLKNLRFPLPGIVEQLEISGYVLGKCEKIDHLITLQKEMITELQAYKQSVITEAVTKGLDPDVSMKDSGVEWLSSIPTSWMLTQLKRFGRIWYGLGEPPLLGDDGLPIIRATNVERGKITQENLIYCKEQDLPRGKDVLLKTGDIIIVRSGAYAGDVGYIDDQWAGSIAGYDMIYRPSNIVSKFILYAMLCPYVLFSQLYLLRERSAQPHLNAYDAGSVSIAIPMSREEQQNIVTYLDEKCEKIEHMIFLRQSKIDTLKEYKKSLIYECVTGKRDCTMGRQKDGA